MRSICSMCKASLGNVASDTFPSDAITHGYCADCANRLLNELAMPVKDFIDCLQEPVLVVDSDVVALTANMKAIEFLGKDLPSIKGFKGGNIIECIHSQEPGGCGKTVHCAGCAIRNTVTDTFNTGHNHLKEPAYVDIPVKGIPEEIRFLISTQKVRGVVWLRIDDVGGNT